MDFYQDGIENHISAHKQLYQSGKKNKLPRNPVQILLEQLKCIVTDVHCNVVANMNQQIAGTQKAQSSRVQSQSVQGVCQQRSGMSGKHPLMRSSQH